MRGRKLAEWICSLTENFSIRKWLKSDLAFINNLQSVLALNTPYDSSLEAPKNSTNMHGNKVGVTAVLSDGCCHVYITQQSTGAETLNPAAPLLAAQAR